MRRIGRIACQAGHPHHPVVLRIKRLQGRVVDRPVVATPSSVRTRKSDGWKRGKCPAYSTVPPPTPLKLAILIGELRVIDRIVRLPRPPVRAGAEIAELTRLPVASGAGIFGRLHPVALLQTEDVHLRLGQAPGHGRAGGTGANDQDVNRAVHAKEPHWKCAAAINGVRVGLSTACCCLGGYPRGGASLPGPTSSG